MYIYNCELFYFHDGGSVFVELLKYTFQYTVKAQIFQNWLPVFQKYVSINLLGNDIHVPVYNCIGNIFWTKEIDHPYNILKQMTGRWTGILYTI